MTGPLIRLELIVSAVLGVILALSLLRFAQYLAGWVAYGIAKCRGETWVDPELRNFARSVDALGWLDRG